MQDLSGCGSRHLLFQYERYRSRTFVAGDTILAPVQNFILRWRCVIPRNDDSVNAHAPFLVRDTDNGDVLDLRVTGNEGLHFRRIDVLSPGNDHVALAINQKNVAVPVAAGEVADRAVVA